MLYDLTPLVEQEFANIEIEKNEYSIFEFIDYSFLSDLLDSLMILFSFGN